MNHYFIDKFKTPPGLINPQTEEMFYKGGLIDKFEELLSIDVYLYSLMLKMRLLSEAEKHIKDDGLTEMFLTLDQVCIEYVGKNNPLNHKKRFKRNKKAVKLLTDHYNNLLDVPYDKSVIKELDDLMFDLNVDIGSIATLLSLIHNTIPFNTSGGINLTLAVQKVFKDEWGSRSGEMS